MTARRRRSRSAQRTEVAERRWTGAYRRYDLVKEFAIAMVVTTLLTVAAAAILSSPDQPAVTFAEWSQKDPSDFVATTVAELAGTSDSAGYGAPYNNAQGAAQYIGPVSLQDLIGVHIPVDSAQDFVIKPLSTVPADPPLRSALIQYDNASPSQQQAWASAYADALSKTGNNPAAVPSGNYGPVPVLTVSLLNLAQSGGLDGAIRTEGGFYREDYTKPLLFLADGGYLAGLAEAQHLAGDQWGMMNETGSYPGQAWLWLYTFWYQIPPFSTSDNADAQIWAIMMFLSALLLFVPFVPGLRSIPRLIPVYRLIWRDHYRRQSGRHR
jgi:hypothetical protein